MATAKKLPSGSWRVLVYDYTDEKGKRHYQSFTSDTPGSKGKREAEYAAAEYAKEKERKGQIVNITLHTAVKNYIASKESILSPSTVAGYQSIYKTHVQAMPNCNIRDVTPDVFQGWINLLSIKHTPKTVRNIYGLLVASITMFSPNFSASASLPARKKPSLYIPTDEEVQVLLEHIKGRELEIAVYLAAFGPMRRGEICAVESSDVTGCNITVSKSMVHHADGSWSVKAPKTYSGYRVIEYPDFVIDRIKGIEGRLVKATPDQITHRFVRAVKYAGLPHFRFHDLRHYAASIMHAIGVPDQYIMGRGGWSSDRVLKEIYRGEMDDQKKKFTATINGHFKKMQHEMQHDSRKCQYLS